MKIALIYPDKFAWCFKAWTESIADCLKSLGHETVICNEVNKYSEVKVEIVQAYLFYGKFNKKPNKKYIMIQGEQFPTYQCSSHWQQEKWRRTQELINSYDIIWDTYLPFHQKLYNDYKFLKCIHYKMGYHKLFDKYKEEPKNHNVSFYGSINPRRDGILRSLNNVHWTGSIGNDDRDKLVNQSKINLNIHYDESHLLQSLRVLLYCLSSKAFVITEPFIGDDDIENGNHLIVANKQDFQKEIDYYLKNEEARKQIAENGYNYMKKHRTMLNSIKYCMNQGGF